MIKKLKPAARFSGSVSVPPDKSITHRAVLLSSIAEGTSTINNPLLAEDCLSTAACVEALGISIEKKPGVWTVNGQGLWGYTKPAAPLNCGNSGTTMRLLSGILAAQGFESELIGDLSLSKRPMDRIAEPLQKMGARVTLRDGKTAPIKISGSKSLFYMEWKSPVASAQVKSCVLLAGLHAIGRTTFEEPSMSRDHTERMLKACGAVMEWKEGFAAVTGPTVRLEPQEWSVPSDFSSAAFFIVAGALIPGARIELKGINLNPTRTGALEILKKMGATVVVENQSVVSGEPVGDLRVTGGALQAASFDGSMVPRLIDEVPILAVAATQAKGVSLFSGIEELRHKETDRISALAKNLKAMGADVTEEEDALTIKGPTPLRGAAVHSFDDHRIAMAFAVAALIAREETTIEGAESVAISYPQFWDALENLCR